MTLPADEVLMCGCGRELAVIEIAGRPTLAHTTNPTFQHHYPKPVRLARTPARSPLGRSDQPELEGPQDAPTRREGPSPERTATAGAPANLRSQSSPAGRARRAEVRPPDSVPRLARSAGSVT